MRSIRALILLSIVLNVILLSLARGYLGMDTACVLALFAYFSFTIAVFAKLGGGNIIRNLMIILIGTCIVHVPLRVMDFRSQLVSLPELICELLGVFGGCVFFYAGRLGRVFVLCSAILMSCGVYLRYEKILDHLNYGNTFNRHIEKIRIDAVPYFDSNNVNVNNTLFNSKQYVILNLWSTSCGPCIAEFPQLDSLYQLSLSVSNIQLYTACILQQGDKKTPFELARFRRVTFPVFTIPGWDLVRSEYGMDGVPVTFVIKDRVILFRGRLIEAWEVIRQFACSST